ARERPSRPIPSGQVSVTTATALGVGLMAAGIAIALWIGRAPGTLAAVLAGCILVYDVHAKHTRVGPLVMGACRGLDLALGLATRRPLTAAWPALAIGGPIVLALYVAGLTYIARDEVDGNTTRRARTGLVFLGVVAIAAVLALWLAPDIPRSGW